MFSQVGGLAEVITFVIAILYSWHNDIRLNQLLINEGILSLEKKKGESKDNNYASKKAISYQEIFSFKYLSCCNKSKEYLRRKEFYEKYSGELDERLNIVKHLRNQGKNNVLHNSLLQPYQIRLLPYVKVGEDAKESDAKHVYE